jgi:ribosomal subunit interface protein
MNKPLDIVFRNMDRSEAIEHLIESKCAQMEKFYHHITSMHVTIEAPLKGRRRHGKDFYQVKIETVVPGKRLVVSQSPGKDECHQALIPAINDSFEAMGRQLEDYARVQRGDVKRAGRGIA